MANSNMNDNVLITIKSSGPIPVLGISGPVNTPVSVSRAIAEMLRKSGLAVNIVSAPQPKPVPPVKAAAPPAAPPPPEPAGCVVDFVEEDVDDEPPASLPASEPPAPDPFAPAEVAEMAGPAEVVEDISKMSRAELLDLADSRGVEVNNRKFITAAKLRELLETQAAQAARQAE